MQFQIYTTFLLVCMTAFVSAAPVPLAVDVELREDIARDLQIEVIREPTCMRLMCLWQGHEPYCAIPRPLSCQWPLSHSLHSRHKPFSFVISRSLTFNIQPPPAVRNASSTQPIRAFIAGYPQTHAYILTSWWGCPVADPDFTIPNPVNSRSYLVKLVWSLTFLSYPFLFSTRLLYQ